MDIESIRDYCLQLPYVEECFPFGDENLVFKVKGKIFAIISLDDFPARINLKCEPSLALEWREQYHAIIPGYHMNKKHWNTLILEGSLPAQFIQSAIQLSFQLVVQSLPKKDRFTFD